ncbi:uncharacterized protein PAN0_007d3265 [Moesziomyces antarcticus]|uniref:Uncharacterized protein n=2 Tax=Pseudozyma antarctica TaxID=84753 RepID=A0A081CEF2_PSEA2|nr:uncharacterized protein PAN0_007d3265 [Moesziomyces antarcticus]GAK65048.1 hypothetical protein PAN0_007d3265 [Moesziomyces antarcticus]SPO45959.1 uncharacterized protein PSANT_03645 [Moesziomyces antarcticus]
MSSTDLLSVDVSKGQYLDKGDANVGRKGAARGDGAAQQRDMRRTTNHRVRRSVRFPSTLDPGARASTCALHLINLHASGKSAGPVSLCRWDLGSEFRSGDFSPPGASWP